jgi:hypothetical protein
MSYDSGNTDSGAPLPPHVSPDLWRLPDVLDLRVRRRHFDPPFRLTVKGVDHMESDAIEIEIRVSEPFAIRALGPVLWVGDEPLTSAESDGKDVYRFFAFKAEELRPDAPISLSWGATGAPRKDIGRRYKAPTE